MINILKIKKQIAMAMKYMSKDAARPVLNTVYVRPDGNLSAADGFMLIIIDQQFQEKIPTGNYNVDGNYLVESDQTVFPDVDSVILGAMQSFDEKGEKTATIFLDARILTRALSGVDGMVRISIADAKTPVIIQGKTGGEKFVSMVMPMHGEDKGLNSDPDFWFPETLKETFFQWRLKRIMEKEEAEKEEVENE